MSALRARDAIRLAERPAEAAKGAREVHPLDIGPFLLRFVAGIGAATFLWLVAVELGVWLVGNYVAQRSAQLALGAALGYALIGSLVALLGVFHAAKPIAVVGIVIGIALLRSPAYVAIARRAPKSIASLASALQALPALSKAAMAVGIFAVFTALVSAALPASWWDPIAYHLPVASAALTSGTFAADRAWVQSAFPALGEAAALPAYALAGSAGAAMATMLAGLALAATVAVLAERVAAGTGPLAGALLTTSALWLWLAPSFYVDIPFALFVVTAIAVPLLALTPEPGAEGAAGRTTGALRAAAVGALCGALAGAAAAIKYPGLVTAAVALAMLVAAGPRPRLLAFGGFAAGLILVASGWYARNLSALGDPVYPFLTGALGFPAPAVAFAGRYVEMTQHWCGGGSDVMSLVVLPWRLLADPRSFCGDPGYALRLGVVFAPVCVATLPRSRPIALACVALTLFWFESSQQWRFLVPSLALFAVLAAAGTAGLGERLRGLGAAILLALGGLGVLVNWIPTTSAQASSSIVPGYAYIAGREDGSAYLRRRLETYGAAEWLAGQRLDTTHVMSLDDVRTYYFGGGLAWANPYYQQEWDLDWRATASERYADLFRHGYRLLLVNASPPYVHRTPTGVDWDVLAADVRAGVLTRVFRDGDVSIYRVRSSP